MCWCSTDERFPETARDLPGGMMGIQERRERERAAVRQQIVDAAEMIAAEKGWDAVTIRAVAGKIEYSPALIYEYFANKDEILFALMRQGFGRLHAELVKVADAVQSPAAAVEAIGLAYWAFALASPTLYQLMHDLRGVPFGTNETPPEAIACFEDLHAPIARLMAESGNREARDSEEQTDLYWAFLHGLVSLAMNQRIKGGTERAATLVRRLAHDFIQSCTGSAIATKARKSPTPVA
jgi:AcrR family transcriptional regulator